MLDKTGTKFSHIKPADTQWVSGGLRDFFLYKDLGIADATHGKVIAHLVKANMAPETGTGWHRHEADFQIVIMLKGWARFMYEDQETRVRQFTPDFSLSSQLNQRLTVDFRNSCGGTFR